MNYNGIFPNSTEFPIPLYPILGILFAIALYIALFQFTLQKIIQKLFSLTNSYDHVQRIIIYLFIINFPMIVLGISCLAYNHSLIGFYIGLDVDLLQCLFISGYICHIEQSRQTPICGFLFLRDIVVAIGFISCFINLFLSGESQISYGFILAGLYFVYYIFQVFEEKIQQSVLKLLKIKESDDFNSTYLLTQTWKEADYISLRETIDENQQRIKESLNQFKQITSRVIVDHDQAIILNNFSKLFLPYKSCFQRAEQKRIEEFEKIFQQQNQKDYSSQDYEYKEQQIEFCQKGNVLSYSRQNFSEAQILNRNTLTDDFIIQQNDLVKQQSKFDIVIKTVFYPVYLMTFVSGRLRYFLDYISIFLLIGCMWLIGNSCYYFTEQTSSKSFVFISFIVSVLLIIPPSRYYLNISTYCDFDFINIFLQSSILKSLIFGIAITVINIVDENIKFHSNIGITISVAIIILTYFVYACFMIALKFATLKSNYKFLVGLLIASYLIRLGTELTLNIFIQN